MSSLFSSCWEVHGSPPLCQTQGGTTTEPTDQADASPANFFRNTFPVTFGPPPASDVGGQLLTTPYFILTRFLTSLSLCALQSHPGLFHTLLFYISYCFSTPPGRINLIWACVNKRVRPKHWLKLVKKGKIPSVGYSLLFASSYFCINFNLC